MADNPWLDSGGGGGGGNPWLGGGGGGPKSKKKGGVFGALSRIPGDVARDLYNAAVESPAAAYELAKATSEAGLMPFAHSQHHDTKKLREIGKGYIQSTGTMIEHPLRNPGLTALTFAPVVGSVGRVVSGAATAGRAASAGDGVRAAAAAGVRQAVKPHIGERTLTVRGATARGHYSRGTLSRGVQKATDALLETDRPGTRRLAQSRYQKWNERTLRTQAAVARSAGTRAGALGQKLKPAEQLAFRFVAEEQPVKLRIAAQEMRAARAKSAAEAGRHRERLDLQHAAAELVDESSGKPVLRDARLQHIYEAMDRASSERGGILKALNLMDEEAQQAAKVKAARFAVGARTVKGGVPLTLDKLKIGDKVIAPGGVPSKVTGIDKATGEVRVLGYDRGSRTWDERTHPVADLDKPGAEIVGGEDVTVSAEAPFIGNPVKRSKISGRPMVGQPRATFGHTRKPTSLKTATGSSVEHAIERQDVTNIIAERHGEAARLMDPHRRVQLVKDALTPSPTSKNDIFVWTDKTVSTGRLDPAVREFFDSPESLEALPEAERRSVLQKLRDATFERGTWQVSEDRRAELERAYERGQGGFLPRRMAGDVGKKQWDIGDVAVVDAVNNAQKLALVYLKANYAVVQTLSNAAMIAVEGIGNPARVAKAVLLDHRVPRELGAVVEDVMGDGAVLQAAFEGRGIASHLSQRFAHMISSRVDRPFRKNAWYQEAIRAGFDTPERITDLLTNDTHANKLGEITQRGLEHVVDFSADMSPFERNVVRRLIFVYPWVKGSTKYAGHFLRDHPVQAAALGFMGERGEQIAEETLGPRPSYLRGIFDVGGGRVVNPAGVNFLQTPASLGQALADPTSGRFAGMLSPAAGTFVSWASGRDDIGRPLPRSGNPLVDIGAAAYKTQVEGIPAIDTAMSWLGHGRASKTFPDPNDPRFRFFFGGLYPRRYDRGALNRNAALEQTRR